MTKLLTDEIYDNLKKSKTELGNLYYKINTLKTTLRFVLRLLKETKPKTKHTTYKNTI